MTQMEEEDNLDTKRLASVGKGSIAARRKNFRISTSLSVDYNCTKLLDYLYLGGQEVTTEKLVMKDTLKITHILNVTIENDCHFRDDFQYMHIKLADSTDRAKADLHGILDQAYAFIEDARRCGGSVLIHCSVGMSRSASLALAYLMISQKMTLYQAFVHTKTKRPVTAPNVGFMEQLIEYERSLFDGVTSFDLSTYRENRFQSAEKFEIVKK